MTNSFRKFTAWLLALIMVFSSMPMNALADVYVIYSQNASQIVDTSDSIQVPGYADLGESEIYGAGITVRAVGDGLIPVGATAQIAETSGDAAAVLSQLNLAPADAQHALRSSAQNVKSANDGGSQAKEGSSAATGKVLGFYDISITRKDGEQYQPGEKNPVLVSVSIGALQVTEGASVSLYHLNGGSVEYVPATFSWSGSAVTGFSFQATGFSVYAVVESGDNARLTVNFATDPEITVYAKKNDDLAQVIYDPGVPMEEGKIFKGWTTEQNYTDDTVGLDIAGVRVAIADMLNAGVEDGDSVTYYPMMFNAFNVFYADTSYDNEIIFQTDSYYSGADTYQATVNAPYTVTSATEGFIGWKVKGGDGTVYKNGSAITLNGDVTLVPEVREGHWLYFDENDGGSGVGGASYTPPVFIASGEAASDAEPDDPTRPGYTFDGWYTAAEGGTRFAFGTVINAETTLHAHWTASTTSSYKVIIWAQKVSDDKNAVDANKTYDYVKTINLTAATDSVINDQLLSAYMNYGNSDFDVTDLAHNSYAFKYRTYEIENGSGANQNGVSATGETVVNVYYDRALFTIVFYESNNASASHTTMTGLYGQTFEQNGYTWPGDYAWWSVSYLSSFNGTHFGDKALRLGQGNQGVPNYIGTYKTGNPNTTIHIYIQDTENSTVYVSYGTMSYQIGTDSRFNVSPRYTGTKFNSYAWSTSENEPGSGWSSTTYTNSGIVFTGTTRGDNTHLHIRFDRLTNDIVFMYGNTTIKKISDIPYEKNIAAYESETPGVESLGTIPEGYYFAGWYENPEFTETVNWNTTMPLANKVIYAQVQPEEYHVIVNTNGGTVENQSQNFWVPYQTQLDDSNFMRATKEGYSLVGWFTDEACTQPWNFDTRLTRASLAIEYTGPEDSNRVNYGDDGWASTVGVFFLYAKWRDDSIAQAGGIQVKYVNPNDAPAYSFADSQRYTDKAMAYAAAAPASSYWPENKKFDHWELVSGSGSLAVNPGQTFEVDSAYADQEGTAIIVTFQAVYADKEDRTPTHIYFYDNYTGATVATYDDLTINQGVSVPDAPIRTGYTFLGWAKDTEHENGRSDVTDLFITYSTDDGYDITIVYADENTPYEALYAVWQINKYTVTFVDYDDTVLKEAAEYDYNTPAESIEKPADPTREGYTFTGWDPEIAAVTEAATYKATYTAVDYTVTYQYTGTKPEAAADAPAAQTYHFEDEVTVAAVPTDIQDYVFVGWTTEDVEVANGKFTMPAKDVAFTGEWKDDKNNDGTPDDEEEFTVIYKDGVNDEEVFPDEEHNGLALNDMTPAFEGSLEREDYVFIGWDPEVAETVKAEDASEDSQIIYTATWKDDKNNNGIPDDEEEYRLIIHYMFENETTAFEDFTRTYKLGDEYNVFSPVLEGYTRTPERVTGVIDGDLEVTVVYTANVFTLLILYRYEDGREAAPASADVVRAGETYYQASPTIPGYRPSIAVVTGVMPPRNLTITVIYTPNGGGTIIDDYDTPLGLGNVGMSVGDCYE